MAAMPPEDPAPTRRQERGELRRTGRAQITTAVILLVVVVVVVVVVLL